MTARIRSLTIALENDIREDDIQSLVSAIKMMKNVISVTPNQVNPGNWATEMRVKMDMAQKLSDLQREILSS